MTEPFRVWVCVHYNGDVLVPFPEECPRCGNHGPTIYRWPTPTTAAAPPPKSSGSAGSEGVCG